MKSKILFLTVIAAGAACQPAICQQENRPNILIIQCDQLTQRVIGAYGNRKSEITPTIDLIAEKGVRFSNAYIGCPLCAPSRAALWTGMMPHQTNVRSNGLKHINSAIPESVITLGQLFTEAGYETVHFGKTHDMGALRGFKHIDSKPEIFDNPFFPLNNNSFDDMGTCRDAVKFLETPPKKPFICVIDFVNPHNICGFVGVNAGAHEDKPLPFDLPELPYNFEVKNWITLPKPIQYICCSHRRMMQASQWTETNYRHYLAAYNYYCKLVDDEIARVMKALKSTPAGENTIIVLLSDHGDGMTSHRMVTKQVSFYDEMTNVPFIISGFGIKHQAAAVNDILTSPTIDLIPTLCEFAKIAPPAGRQGISLVPLLKGEKMRKTHDYVASEWHTEWGFTIEPGRMIRSARFKYTKYIEENGEELYDMIKDPGEMENLACNLEYLKILNEHRKLLGNYIKETNDDFYSLEIKVDPRWRSHKLGYPNHEGICAPDVE